MKKILNIFCIIAAGVFFSAQQTDTENYIYSKSCLDADCVKKAETVQYFDGLGRPKQSVAVKASPSGKDVVSHIEYDQYGRVSKSYLPVPQTETRNGGIYENPLANATSPGIYGSEKIYAQQVIENSPLERVKQSTGTGNAWSGKHVDFQYTTNTTSDGVKKYPLITTWTDGRSHSVPGVPTVFAVNTLMKTSVTDEDGNMVTEFKNGKGQTVLVRKNTGTANVDTYYLYDLYGRLAYVVPPLASGSSSLDQATLDNLCYQYRYDGLGRLVEKKLPGKGWEYLIYNKADQLVMSQDANLRVQNKWMLTKYDQFGRIVLTGITNNTATRQSLQTSITGAAYTFELRSAGSFTISGMPIYYTNRALPASLIQVLSINYYDTYPNYSFAPAFPGSILGQTIITDGQNASVSTKALPTLSLVKNIDDDSWTKNYVYYDTKGRAAGTHTINHLGGYTKTESEFDFTGLAKQTKVYHKRLSTDTEKVLVQTFEYDSQNRLKKHYHQVGTQPQELLSENTYNELSQLSNKKVGSNLQSIDYTYNIRGALTKMNDPAALGTKLFGYELKYHNPQSPGIAPGKYNGNIAEVNWKTASDQVLRQYNYEYDGLSRLTKGVYSEPGASLPQNGFFNETLAYDLNGNITSLQRNGKSFSGTAQLMDNLVYQYTGNRLNSVADISGNYSGYPDSSGNTITYDDNGNMKDHVDKGVLQINYNFLNLPNYVKFDQTFVPRATDGEYNVNTKYFYKADGTKLKKIYTYGMGRQNMETSRTTEYLDSFQYETQGLSASAPLTLRFVPTAEGYYNFENNKYIYNYTDHLGNTRLSYTRNSAGTGAEIIEENNYYPFGLRHTGYNALDGNPAYNYQYNGKELQKETGWNDYGARMYMSDIGRWGVIDPLAETSRAWSPYRYAYNNPLTFIDPDGRKERKSSLETMVELGGSWKNTGSGFSNGRITLGYDTPGVDSPAVGSDMLDFTLGKEYFKGIDFSKFKNNKPDDIIIRNNKGHIMYRIISDIKKDVQIDTDVEIGNPMTINLEDYKKKGVHAVGFSLDYSGTFGGGMNGGVSFVYFISGDNAGSGFLYGYKGGNTGLEGSVGVSKFYSTFVDNDKKNFNAEGYAGKSSGHAFGVGIWGYSKSWGNRTNDGELWQGQKSKTTWVTISNGVGHGGSVGAKVFWSDYILLKKIF
ncbi:DUF6443 domain-containing protein [Chryseobacterium phocaeense]|uniref:DUF6443 domain-containing protein n=1 Tax=Chryseobacterium phocaeense TaxID=1816690 RepID=UPI0013EF2E04|nr:DUF6443 domain-containing protein [Chryseobacterium phocaeense]